MTFAWPEMLWLLLAVPALVALYLVLLRRKKKAALRYASLAMVKEAMGAGQRFRRHVPPLLFLLAIILMIAAVSRPAALVTLPSQQETIILAMDVSGSMRAVDVQPNRITAAQAAAKAFVAEQPRNVRIGVVSFAATAAVVQYPTQNREDIHRRPSTASNCSAAPPSAAASSFRWRPFSRCGHRRELVDLRPRRAARAFRSTRRQGGKERVQAGAARLLRLCRDHFAYRRPEDHRPRLARGRQDGRRPRRARLHRRSRHESRRDHRLRRLVHARAARRGDAQSRSRT